jgi:hypothetical protein
VEPDGDAARLIYYLPGPPPAVIYFKLEMRTVAGPWSAEQWVLSGGPYTVWSHCRHVHVVCPPP